MDNRFFNISHSSRLGNQGKNAFGKIEEGFSLIQHELDTQDSVKVSKLVGSDGSPDPAVSVDANGYVGIGVTNPMSQLDIGALSTTEGGEIHLRGGNSQLYDYGIDAYENNFRIFRTDLGSYNNWTELFNLSSDGTTLIFGTLFAQDTTISSSGIEVNANGAGNRFAHIDFHGDDSVNNVDYALRIIRDNAGENADSRIDHKGTGTLRVRAEGAGSVSLMTDSKDRFTVDSAGSAWLTQENQGVDANLNLLADPGNSAAIYFRSTGGVRRWVIYKTGETESGSNAGSKLAFGRYADDGEWLGDALLINRATGDVDIFSDMYVTGNVIRNGEVWNTPTLKNGWTQSNATLFPARYRKFPDGKVRIEGRFTGGTIGQSIFQLPAGYRATKSQVFLAVGDSIAAISRIAIDEGGNVYVSSGNVTNVNIYFDFYTG